MSEIGCNQCWSADASAAWEQGGEDPIYRTIMPIDKAERSRLNASTPLSKRVLESTGVGRRALKYDWPGGQAPSIYGGTRVHVGIHDYSRCNFSSERMSY